MINKLTKILLVLVVLAAAVLGYLKFTYDEKVSDAFTVTLTGDLYYDKNFMDWIENNLYEDYYAPIQPLLKNSDVTIGNLVQTIDDGESVTDDGTKKSTGFPDSYLEAIAEAYPRIGFDFMTCANAQSKRKGIPATEYTNKVLDKYKIGHTGLFASEREKDKVEILNKKGFKIAVLSYTTILNPPAIYDEDEDKPDFDYAINMIFDEEGRFDTEHKKQIKKDVAYAKTKADIVIVAMNWGKEYTYDISNNQMIVTNFLSNLGVDVIVGNHPHISQKVDIMTNSNGEKTYVFYSLGSLVNSRVAPAGKSVSETGVNMAQVSSLVQFDLAKNEDKDVEIENVRIIPIVNHYEKGFTNFQLIPLSEYTEELASSHAQAQYTNFTKSWIWDQYENLYGAQGLFYKEKINKEE